MYGANIFIYFVNYNNTMKLIKHFVTKDKKYYKYEAIIPNKKVEEAGFSDKDELEIEVKKGEIKLRRK